jgi:2-dehydropantoate 2-reductase
MVLAAAEGVTPRGFGGFEPAAFQPGASAEAARASVANLAERNRPNAKTHSGIWRDLWVRKRRTECDAQLVPMAEIARRHGIAVPVLDRLIALTHECEAGTRPMSDDNLLELARA